MAFPLPQIQEQEKLRKEESNIHPSLHLDIDDKDLIRIIKQRIIDDENFYSTELKLDKRRKKMEEFYLGKQVDTSTIDENWQLPYVDNLIWQDLETRIGLAAATLPEVECVPPNDDNVSKERAKKVERALEIRLNNENIRRLIKDGLRDNHLFLIGVIKIRWDPNLGEFGDFVFEKVNPKKISMDHRATIPHDGYTADNMEIIYEWIEEPVGLVCAKFPDKKEELLQKLKITVGTTTQMASKMRYMEIWFTWYDKDGNQQEGVCWKFKNMILGKSKNPYYDWEGIEKPTNELDENGKPIIKTVLQNYFDRPRKPYIFITYQNLGNSPIDDTTAVEQAISLQQNINKRGRQITEIADNAVPKKIFSGNYITKEEARRVSNDPSEHIWLEGAEDVTKAFATVRSDPPSPILFQDLVQNRTQVDSKFGTHSVTRGETVSPHQSGIAKQITREGDVSVSDDLVQTVVVRIITEMAGWAVQMMKTQYNKEHKFRSLDANGELSSLTLSQESIDEGIGIQVKASTIDKVRRRAEAVQLATQDKIDPLTLYEDMNAPNPKERVKRLLAFLRGNMDGYASYEKICEINQEQPTSGAIPTLDKDQAISDIESLEQGKDIQLKAMPSEEYVKAFMEYVNSGKIEILPPKIQQNFVDFIQKMKAEISRRAAQPGTTTPNSMPSTATPSTVSPTETSPTGITPMETSSTIPKQL